MIFSIRSGSISAIVLSALMIFQPSYADDAVEKGLTIAKESKARDRGWKDNTAELTMVLRNKAGRETTRKMRVKGLERLDDGDLSMTIFDTPRDVAGTSFLSHTHINVPDDQWLYLPALKRVKRISSKNKSGPFMGSEFSYEDLSSFEVAKFSYRWLRDEVYEGKDCYVIESVPVDRYSGYTKQIGWIDKAEYRSFKIDFYDRRDTLMKTLTIHDYAQYNDKYWRPGLQKMVNHKNGKSTDISMNNYQFSTGLNEADFTENSLKRAR